MIRFLEYAAIFLLLLVLQEFVFDNINLGGMVNPYIYIMFIILLPLDIPGWGLLLLGFGAGGAVDVMEGTAGLQTMTATWLAFARPTVVGLLLGKDLVYEGGIPTVGRERPSFCAISRSWFCFSMCRFFASKTSRAGFGS